MADPERISIPIEPELHVRLHAFVARTGEGVQDEPPAWPAVQAGISTSGLLGAAAALAFVASPG